MAEGLLCPVRWCLQQRLTVAAVVTHLGYEHEIPRGPAERLVR